MIVGGEREREGEGGEGRDGERVRRREYHVNHSTTITILGQYGKVSESAAIERE